MSALTRRQLPLAFAGLVGAASAAVTAVAADMSLAGTAWKLVRFTGGDGNSVRPDDPAKYTLQFEPGGRLFARIDCNRGSGTWEASTGSELRLGMMAVTRAMCPPGSLHDQVLKHLPLVRTFKLSDDHLVLNLDGDGGAYEFASAEPERTGPKK